MCIVRRSPSVIATCLILAFLAAVPRAHGQGTTGAATIAGVVRDTSGAVMPGVTIEAASPALIERARSATTDAQGQYKIVQLPPNTYSVTFSLTGFETLRHEGIVLTANFTAPVNAEMRLGQLQETVTVSGGTPLVDVQGVVVQQVISRDLLD